MLLTLEELLRDRPAPTCVRQDTKVSDALAVMISNDYSQLPVVDEQGHLLGIVSEQTITQTYFHSGAVVSLLDLDVSHCSSQPVTLPPETDISTALGFLKDTSAVVVVKDKQPYRILTDYDTTQYFYGVSRSLIIIEGIELSLRQYIETLVPTENAMLAALMHAFKTDKRDPTRPAREYTELSLGEHVQLIVTEENWPKFEPFLGPKKFFKQMMEQIGEIRNQQMHFRGEIDSVQYNALIHARDWLSSRPKPKLPGDKGQQTVRVTPQDLPSTRPGGKYSVVEEWLVKQRSKGNLIEVSFQDIEELLGEPLPQSAYENRSWWANDSTSHVQSLAWLRAGWQVADVDFSAKVISFRQTTRSTMQLFFTDLLERIRQARPGLTRATKGLPQNWMSIGAGKSGFGFAWVFSSEDKLRVELYIDMGDKEQNKAAFDRLKEQKEQIEQQFGGTLHWERLDQKQASRISISRPARISDPPDELEQAMQWAIETGLRFIDALQPRVRELQIR